MDEAKAMAEHQQQLLLHYHHQQQQQQQRHHHQQQQQQMLLLQHLQKQQQHPAMDPHLRSQALLHHTTPNLSPQQSPNPNPSPNPISPPSLQQQSQHHHQQLEPIRPSNQAELQMAYQDAWRVCHPDFKLPFTNLEDACGRLLPYHVVADYEAEEDDRILDTDTTGLVPSRSQQWEHNIEVKVEEFTATFKKQTLAYNIISRKRATGEFRSEERLMVEQALLQDEKRAMLELRAHMESREKAEMEMAAMAMADQARAESRAHAQMIARANAVRSQRSGQFGYFGEQEQGMNQLEMANGWGRRDEFGEQEQGMNQLEMANGWGRRDEPEYFLKDEETENGYDGMQGEWREVGQFDLNTDEPIR